MSTTYVDTDNERGGELATPAYGVRAFVAVSIGQFIAVSGLTLLNFAAAFYFYKKSYALIIVGLVYALPFIVLVATSPIAGSLIDRWGARRALLVSNVGGLLLVGTLVVVPFTHTVSVWHGFAIVMLVPLLKALLLPAFETSVPFLVPKRHIGRANGMRMFINAVGAALGPVVAVVLLHAIGIYGVGLLVALFLGVGLVTLLLVQIPRVRREDATPARVPVLFAEFKRAWDHVRARHGLPALLVFFAVTSCGIGFVEVLLPRLVLAFASDGAFVTVLGVGVVGMIVTGVAMTVWGGPWHRVRGLLAYSLLFAVAMMVGSLRPNVGLIAVAAFCFLGSTSIIIGEVQTILNTKVEPQYQGRVMGLKNAFYGVLLMVGNILAGLGAGAVQPLVGKDHVRSRVVAAVVGDGPGRGFAVLMLAMGVLIALCVLVAHRYPRLRDLEATLPDMTPEDLALESARQ